MISSKLTDAVYIGYTTCWNLQEYFEMQKDEYRMNVKKQRTSKHIIQFGDAQISLIENWPCASKEEAESREAFWIQQYPNSVNQVIANVYQQSLE